MSRAGRIEEAARVLCANAGAVIDKPKWIVLLREHYNALADALALPADDDCESTGPVRDGETNGGVASAPAETHHAGGRPSGSHPEDFCERCKRPNAVWFVASPLWNAHARPRGYGIVCPVCFIEAAEADGVVPPSWEVRPGHAEPDGDVVERAAKVLGAPGWPPAVPLANSLSAAGLLARPVDRERLARRLAVWRYTNGCPREVAYEPCPVDYEEADAILREMGR